MTRIIPRFFLILSSTLLFPLSCTTAQPTSPGIPDRRLNADPLPSSVFTACPSYPFRELKGSILDKEWYALPVTSGESNNGTSDFHPLFLPFTTSSGAGSAHAGEELLFPALLSFKFDYVPDNINASHPFFTFRKYPELRTLTPAAEDKLKTALREREATHAVCGELKRSRNGYSGTIRVYDREIRCVFSHTIPRPEEYFSLMGLMVKAWMDFRGQKVSPGLLNELTRNMTGKQKSLSLLADIFSLPLQGTEEDKLLSRILREDKDFGEVHYWYANQLGWRTGDHLQAMEEKARALSHHPVVAAVREFNPSLVRDNTLTTIYTRTVSYLRRILPGHPLLDYLTLKDDGPALSPEHLDKLVPNALNSPSDYHLLQMLAYQYDLRLRYEKSIPLYLSALNSGYNPRDGKYDLIYAALSNNFRELGYKNEAANFSLIGLNYCQPAGRARLLRGLGHAFSEGFLFDKAALLLEESFNLEPRDATIFYGYMDLYMAGDTATLLLWEQNPAYNLRGSYKRLIESRNRLSKGYHIPAGATLKNFLSGTDNNPEIEREAEIIFADLELCRGNTEAALGHTIKAWRSTPRSRRVSYLLEQCLSSGLEKLGPYAEVASLIFAEDTYHQQLMQRAEKKGYKPVPDSEILLQYNRLAEKQSSLDSSAEKAFWRQQGPFAIEYLALRLIHMQEKKMHEAGVRLYIAYATSLADYSKCMCVHLRAFFPLLLRDFPKIEKAHWLDVLDYELAAS